MPNPRPDLTLNRRILEALRLHPEGMTRPDLQAAVQSQASPQVFRRLLGNLEAQGLIDTSGRTRSCLYHLGPKPLPASVGFQQAPAAPRPPVENYPPLSPEGDRLRRMLALPLAQRKPVSYQRNLLDAYRPNATFYLPEPIRSRLHELGGPKGPPHPAGTYARQILQNFLVDLSWASSQMEGNTYSRLDTERLIEQGKAAEGKDLLETQMILNHKAAIEYLVDGAEDLRIDPATLMNLHAILMDNLMGNAMDEGRLRTSSVNIHGTVYVPLAVPPLIEECFRQILHLAWAIEDPFEQSFFLLVHLPYLQPFMDGNKRTARLAANIPFIRKNCIPIAFMDVAPEAFTDGMLTVYELNKLELLREVFVHAYERSCERYGAIRSSLGEPDPFRLAYRSQIKTIVREVVLAAEHGQTASDRIKAFAEGCVPKDAQDRFRAVVETEISGLHEGNFARYRVRPSEFAAWKQA